MARPQARSARSRASNPSLRQHRREGRREAEGGREDESEHQPPPATQGDAGLQARRRRERSAGRSLREGDHRGVGLRHRQASGSGTADAVRALWYSAAGQAELRQERLSPPGEGECGRAPCGRPEPGHRAAGLRGARSGGGGRADAGAGARGRVPVPVKYGYCAVAETDAGERVFALQPHQEAFNAPRVALCPLPEGLPPRRAVLAANMETALNAVWESGAGPGTRSRWWAAAWSGSSSPISAPDCRARTSA